MKEIIIFNFRISKCDPQFRNQQGAYLKNEWTSFSEIGKIFDNKEFTIDEYIAIENAYIKSVILFMDCNKIKELKITQLEKGSWLDKNSLQNQHLIKIFDNIKNNIIISKNLIPDILRLILREIIWFKLEAPEMYVHFGYDYYMYIGSSKKCDDAMKKIEDMKLFVENFKSLY